MPEHANKLAYSLGGLSVAAFLSLLVSGVALARFYDPERADPTTIPVIPPKIT